MINKTTIVSFTLLLAGSASAQIVSILPGGRGNIYIGTPTNLPGPLSNIVISPRISLPAPLLTPTVALTLSPVPMASAFPALPIALPTVALPYPALRAQFAAPAKDGAAKDVVASREKLENLFDGSKKNGADDERGPVRSGRHVSLPEHDLENEIGAY